MSFVRAAGVRAIALMLAGALPLALVGGCSRPPRPTEIAFWQYWPAATMRPLLARFERENPGIHVQLTRLDWRGGPDSIQASIASGRVPDLCEVGSAELPRYLNTGALTDWSAGVADLRSSLHGWDLCRMGDAIYGLPWLISTHVMFYNPALLTRARLDPAHPPATWGELAHAAGAIQRLGGGVHGFGLVAHDSGATFEDFMPWAWGDGAEILSIGFDSVLFDSPATREALVARLRLRNVSRVGAWAELEREFEAGRLGLLLGPAELSARLSHRGDVARYRIAPVPQPESDRGSHASIGGGELLVSLRGARRKEAALRLARFLVRPDNLAALAVSEGEFESAAVGADTASAFRSWPERQLRMRQVAGTRFVPTHPAWAAMEAAIESELDSALADRRTPPESAAAHATAGAMRSLVALLRKR